MILFVKPLNANKNRKYSNRTTINHGLDYIPGLTKRKTHQKPVNHIRANLYKEKYKHLHNSIACGLRFQTVGLQLLVVTQ